MDSNQAASNLADGKELWGAAQNGRLFFFNEEWLNYNISIRCTTQSFNIFIPYKTITKVSPAPICYPYICNIITILLTIFPILCINTCDLLFSNWKLVLLNLPHLLHASLKLSLGNHQFVFCTYEYSSVLLSLPICFHFQILPISEIIQYLSLSDLFNLA